jgi:ferredoxin
MTSSSSPSTHPAEVLIRLGMTLRVRLHATSVDNVHSKATRIAGQLHEDLAELATDDELRTDLEWPLGTPLEIEPHAEAPAIEIEIVRFDGPPIVRVEFSHTAASQQREIGQRHWVVSIAAPPGASFALPERAIAFDLQGLLQEQLGCKIVTHWFGPRIAVVEVECVHLDGMDRLREAVRAAINDGGLKNAQLTRHEQLRPMICRGCGCTDDAACPGGCSWVAENLCSQCGTPEAL